MRFFQHDAPAWRAASALGDLILLNILTVVCCLPVVTAGASLTALADTCRRMSAGDESPVWRLFGTSLRANFAASTAAWAVVGPVGALLTASWIFLRTPDLLVLKVLLTLCFLLGFPFLFSLLARFENRWHRHLVNAWLIAVGNLPIALGVLVIHAGFIALLVAVTVYAPQGLALLLLIGVSLPWMAATPLIERAFRPLLDPASADGSGTPSHP